MKKEYLVIAAAIGITGIAYYLWKSSKPKAPAPPSTTSGGTPSKPCAADEVEQQVTCIAAPCPSMCVKKTGFTGGNGSFFNPIRGRNQDTSF
jgi:hypothetical protein